MCYILLLFWIYSNIKFSPKNSLYFFFLSLKSKLINISKLAERHRKLSLYIIFIATNSIISLLSHPSGKQQKNFFFFPIFRGIKLHSDFDFNCTADTNYFLWFKCHLIIHYQAQIIVNFEKYNLIFKKS